MNKIYFKIFVFVLVAFAMGSCVYDFNPDSDELEGLDKPLVVIEGDIIVGGTTKIKLGYTTPVIEGGEYEAIDFTGSSVWVESEDGEIWSGQPHHYYTSSQFDIDTESLPADKNYRLCVSIPGRGEYQSAFKSVNISPQIDSISYSYLSENSGIQIEVSTHNDAKEPLYCRWSYVENWESNSQIIPELRAIKRTGEEIKIEFVYLTEQEVQERTICYSRFDSKDICIAGTDKLQENIIYKSKLNMISKFDRRLSSLYAITVTQTAMDKEAYKYWQGVKASVSGTGGLFAPMPNEVRGNIVCNTNPEEIVLGYINVTTVTTKRKFIYAKDLMLYRKDCMSTSYKSEYWADLVNAGAFPVKFGETEEGELNMQEVYWTSKECVDCRSFSNSARPDFWPEGR